MPKLIECRRCDSPNCKGCNMYTLATMLNHGKFNSIMDDHHSINPSAYVEVVQCKDCWYFHQQNRLYGVCNRPFEAMVTRCVDDFCSRGRKRPVYCKDCKHLMFSDFYGECSKAYLPGIVRPEDSCGRGERKEKGEKVMLGRPRNHFVKIESYIKHKIRILKQLGIRLTNAEREHIKSLKTEIAVDNYARSIILREDS